MKLEIRRHRRNWAVYRNGQLVCVTVYRKGARALVALLQEMVG